MTTITTVPRAAPVSAPVAVPQASRWRTAFATLSRRRFALSAHTPREILVPLLTPILFADVIAPALAVSIGSFGGLDYVSYVAIGTVGLLVPLSCVLGGVGLIVDRESGGQRDLLAAPIPRSLIVFALQRSPSLSQSDTRRSTRVRHASCGSSARPWGSRSQCMPSPRS